MLFSRGSSPALTSALVAEVDHLRVCEERQNFDPGGHDARPDVTRLRVDCRRQTTLTLEDCHL